MITKTRPFIAGIWHCLLIGSAFGQTPPPAPQVRVSPPDGTIMITETTNSVFVSIRNFDVFTNVTVVGTFGSQQNLPFLDDGQPPDGTANDGTFSADLIMPKVPVSVASNVTLKVVVTAEVPPPDPLPPKVSPPPDPEPGESTRMTYRIPKRTANIIDELAKSNYNNDRSQVFSACIKAINSKKIM